MKDSAKRLKTSKLSIFKNAANARKFFLLKYNSRRTDTSE